jgi:glyoxylate utilization-related uncharacterized protein
MANTYIDTNKLPHTRVAGAGEYVEVLNNALCGAKNVVGSLRWLQNGDTYDAANDAKANQLLYVMEGEATITLDGKDHQVGKGHGVYLGPGDSARIAQRGAAALKLFQLVVPKFS